MYMYIYIYVYDKFAGTAALSHFDDTHINTHTHLYTYMHIYTYTCIYMYICILKKAMGNVLVLTHIQDFHYFTRVSSV